MTVRVMQAHLAADNRNFRAEEFLERIEAHAELDRIVDEISLS